jgi:hypothetical protein
LRKNVSISNKNNFGVFSGKKLSDLFRGKISISDKYNFGVSISDKNNSEIFPVKKVSDLFSRKFLIFFRKKLSDLGKSF